MKARLRFLRLLKDLTEEELSEKLGITTKRIKELENGKEPYSDELIKYADFFNVSIEFIVRAEAIPVPEKAPDGTALSETDRHFLKIVMGFNDQGKEELFKLLPAYIEKHLNSEAESEEQPSDKHDEKP